MKLTRRSKWLAGGAASIAVWVAFGPGDPDAVQPARGAASPAARAPHAAASSHASAALAPALFSLAHRVVEQTSTASLFTAHSWYVAPPPPPPAVVNTTPVAPPKPTAPPLPYQFIGSYTPEGQPTVFFLSSGDRVYDVHIGDTLDNTYSIDSFGNGQLVLTYKPLNIQQQLPAGTGQ